VSEQNSIRRSTREDTRCCGRKSPPMAFMMADDSTDPPKTFDKPKSKPTGNKPTQSKYISAARQKGQKSMISVNAIFLFFTKDRDSNIILTPPFFSLSFYSSQISFFSFLFFSIN
jgi:hypothetical protein